MKTDSVLLLVLASMVPCHVMADSSTTTINVKATGQVVVPSDLLVLQLLVEIDRADVQEAKDENDRITTRLYELAKSQEIPRPRLLNTGLRFGFGRESSGKRGRGDEKNEPYDEAESGKPSILISRDLEVRFDNLPQAVRFLSEIVKWDSVCKTHELRLMPMRVEVADRKSPSLEARRRAVESAREKATLLAEQTGRRLGDAIQIFDDVPQRSISLPDDPFADPFEETGGRVMQQHVPTDFRFVAVSTAPVTEELDLDQLPPAQVTISATVTVVFEAHKP